MSKPKIIRAEIFSPFGMWPNKIQWCVVSQEDRHKLPPNDRKSDPRIFGHGDTIAQAWEDYLNEVKEYDEFLKDCENNP